MYKTVQIILFIFLSNISFSQLSNFTFQVTPQNETCLGNGSLTFAVSGTAAGSTLSYSVYLLPNIVSPIAVLNSSTLTGLNAGDYLVVATQSLGALSGSQQQNVTINNNIATLDYTLVGQKVKCGNDGAITVNIISGNPASYEIVSGPVTTSPQTSNSFSNLGVGIYEIKVTDVCGDAVVQTYTLVQALISLVIDPGLTSGQLPSCNTVNLTNFFGVPIGYEIAYPITFEYTVYPPGGGSPFVSNVIANNTFSSVSLTIPFYHNQSYYYDIKATDACGNVYQSNNNLINKKIDFTILVSKIDCTTKQLSLTLDYFVAPYTIDFVAFPVGFNPTTFNTIHPGPFTSGTTVYGGIGNSFPNGSYTIQVTDACGRTVSKNVTIQDSVVNPSYFASSNGCGQVTVFLQGAIMQSVIITSAPTAYTYAIPHNVSSFIDPITNIFSISGLPVGTYNFQITDTCNNIYNLTIVVPPYSQTPFVVLQKPGCDDGYGSVRVDSNVLISNAVLLSGPSNYTGTFPLPLSIIGGTSIYLSNLPEGDYVVQSTNFCGVTRTDSIHIVGYQEIQTNVQLQKYCGSFNLYLEHSSNTNNSDNSEVFWIQKYNSALNLWEHPITGYDYVEGSLLTGMNGISISNYVNNINLQFSGIMRIVKVSKIYSFTGQSINCIKTIHSFEIADGPTIINVDTIGCLNGNSEAIVIADGVPPLNYRITTKDGAPFLIENNNLSSFSSLSPGIYNFQVEDSCGNIVNSLVEITSIAPFGITSTLLCNNEQASLSVPNYPFLTYEWWKDSNPANILSTSNVLSFNPFNNLVDYGTYKVKITNASNISSCFNVELSETISNVFESPKAGLDSSTSFCENQQVIDLNDFLSGSFDSNGVWSEISGSNTLAGNLWNANLLPYGTYQFLYTVSSASCGFDDALITLELKEKPILTNVPNSIGVCVGDDILIDVGIENVNYLWEGPNGFFSTNQNLLIQDSDLFDSGVYSLIVTKDGCESDIHNIDVLISNQPNFILKEDCLDNVKTLEVIPQSDSFNINDVTIEWIGPNNYTSSTNLIQIPSQAIGEYSAQVINNGCSKIESIIIQGTACGIQSGISPNDDGKNDSFDLSGYDVENLKIFSRYGREVYNKDNYESEWYGQDYNDNMLPAATYYYYIKLTNGIEKTGWIYLVRE